MKIIIDLLNTEEFIELNKYISREENFKGQQPKVRIVNIDKTGCGYDQKGQFYKGIEIELPDFRLNKCELEELLDIIYYKK